MTYAVVIQNADFQDASGLNFTGLGTLDNGLYWFTTATRKQMDLRTHIEFMTEYDERRLKDTMDMSQRAGNSDISFNCAVLQVDCTL